ncbi:hypothetical protein V9T40_009601 [Parthenolecanium corni]|uniref:BSD domain-containing protein n=1 Tax=Parthenolecanium corni TaxID=536013 RepID=A0AAN9TN33_9HEMI
MAEDKNQNEVNENNDENAWWKSWYNSAKSKSEEVFDYLKQDLTEISSTVRTEAASIINSTTSVISEGIPVNIPAPEWSNATASVKESVSSFINTMSSALNPQPLDGDEEPYIVENDRIVSISKFQSKLYLLSADSSTYLNDIEDNLRLRYSAWLESLKNYEFNPLANEKLTKLLLSNSRLKENYDKLVPEQISHGEFWNRYLFRKALLEDEEAEKHRRRSLEKKVCESLEWEKESFGSHLSLSEEEQGQILQEYEKERCICSKLEPENKDENIKSELHGSNAESEVSSVQSANDRGKHWESFLKSFDILPPVVTNTFFLSESSSDDWEKDFDIDEIP